jgi:hypothetical protein
VEKLEQLSGQKTFASSGGWDCPGKPTRRHLFLQTMNHLMPWQALLDWGEPRGDTAYVGQEATIRQKAPKARNCILQRASRGHPLSAWQKKWNQLQNAIRAKGEHVFGTFF